jgi:hypothetical protein
LPHLPTFPNPLWIVRDGARLHGKGKAVNALYRTGLPCARCCGEIEGAAPVAYLIRVFVGLAKAGPRGCC